MSATTVEAVMKQLKKDWADLAARSQVSEVGLDVDRAELLARYRDEGLTQQQIAECLGIGQQRVSQLLVYQRYLASTSGPSRAISATRFHEYWKQIADPKMTRARHHPIPEYEAACFADIRNLIEAGKPPHKRKKKASEIKPEDIKGVKDLYRTAKKIFNGPLRKELERLKRLSGADRSTYAPTMLADAAAIIEREIIGLFKILGAVPDEAAQTAGGDR